MSLRGGRCSRGGSSAPHACSGGGRSALLCGSVAAGSGCASAGFCMVPELLGTLSRTIMRRRGTDCAGWCAAWSTLQGACTKEDVDEYLLQSVGSSLLVCTQGIRNKLEMAIRECVWLCRLTGGSAGVSMLCPIPACGLGVLGFHTCAASPVLPGSMGVLSSRVSNALRSMQLPCLLVPYMPSYGSSNGNGCALPAVRNTQRTGEVKTG